MFDQIKPLRKQVLREANKKLRRCEQEKRFRPTAAIVIKHRGTGKFLIIYGTPEGDVLNPGLVKGGVHQGESLLTAARREIREEIGLLAKTVAITGLGGCKRVHSLKKTEGFDEKLYFVLFAETDEFELKVDRVEVTDYRWCDRSEVEGVLEPLRSNRLSKWRLLTKVFRMIPTE